MFVGMTTANSVSLPVKRKLLDTVSNRLATERVQPLVKVNATMLAGKVVTCQPVPANGEPYALLTEKRK